ncbi:Sugar carrier protein C [Arachis hypogaea]|nr:Sugar carrier protein C [Arachis hypogaea]
MANVLNYFFANIKGGWEWRLSFGGAMVSALIITIGLLVLPDTPNSMIERGKHKKATQQLRKVPDVEDIDEKLFQLSITVGILVTNVLNYFFANIKGGWGWRLSFGGAMVSARIITIGLLVLPDTPNSMIERGEHEKATQQLRKVPDVEDIDEEFNNLIAASEESKKEKMKIGVLVANVLNYFFANIKGGWGWRLSFGGAMVSALIITIGSLVLPDTPNSMIERGEHEKARQQLRKVPGVEDIDEEFNDLIAASEESKKVEHPWRNLLQRKYRPHLTMAIMIPFFQQFIGIIVIMFYAPVLFGSIGFKDNYALMSSVITGVINVAATVVSIYGVDKWGRRALFLEGGAQMIICQAVVAAAIGAKFRIDGNPVICQCGMLLW